MAVPLIRLAALVLLVAVGAPGASRTQAQGRGGAAQPLAPGQTNDPFPDPIPAAEGVLRIAVVEYATLPDSGAPARMMLLAAEPGGQRLFVNDMRGPLYSVAGNGKTVTLYLDINDPKWNVGVQSQNNERGFQSFAFHPQFNQAGSRGFGKFYTYTDTTNTMPSPDFTAMGATNSTHDTVLLEWTAKTPGAATYDGGAPRELIRIRQPFANHNAGHLAFNPNAAAGSPEFGLLYMGVADGGSGGDPLNLSQNMASAFGKVFRIDPLGTNSANRKYGVPAANPFVRQAGALPEIFALGVRNPQRFAWDPRNGNMFLADIGQNIVEEVSLVTAGANLGWNLWEGSYRFISRQAVSTEKPRSDPKITYPVVEYGQIDPLLQNSSAATGVVIYRGSQIPALANVVLFGDNPSGEVFYFDADKLPNGGQSFRRVLFTVNGASRTLLQMISDKRASQGRAAAPRADLRFGTGPGNQVFLLNRQDNTIRLLVAGGSSASR
jgi:hypothetical protein